MYSTDDDLLLEFPLDQLEEITGGTSLDTDQTALARERADDLIDSFLAGGYEVPLESPVPALINKISVDLTIAYLYESDRLAGFVPETVYKRKQSALKLLEDFVKGNLILTSAAGSPCQIYNVGDGTPIFPEDVLDDFLYS
jgi:phage gp36-like protein